MKVKLIVKNGIIYGYDGLNIDERLVPTNYVDLTEEQLELIDKHIGCIDIHLNVIPSLQNRREKVTRIRELKRLLSETDYMAIKYAEGAISEYDYIDTRKVRQTWRDEINQLESELDGNSGTN